MLQKTGKNNTFLNAVVAPVNGMININTRDSYADKGNVKMYELAPLRAYMSLQFIFCALKSCCLYIFQTLKANTYQKKTIHHSL